MSFLPAAAAPSWIILQSILGADPAHCFPWSFDPQTGVAHHLAPLFHLQLDARGELVGLIGDRLEAEGRKPLLDVGPRNSFGDLAGQQLDDLFWRTRGSDDAGQRIGLLILDALLGARPHSRHLLRALRV